MILQGRPVSFVSMFVLNDNSCDISPTNQSASVHSGSLMGRYLAAERLDVLVVNSNELCALGFAV